MTKSIPPIKFVAAHLACRANVCHIAKKKEIVTIRRKSDHMVNNKLKRSVNRAKKFKFFT